MSTWRTALAALIVATVGLYPEAVWANASGRTGASGKQGGTCNACHGGGTAPTVRFEGPTEIVAGAVATYRFVVHAQSDGQNFAGFNVAASAGTLEIVADQGGRKSGSELTHSAPKMVDSNREAAWEFTWTAPPTSGAQKLFGAGNSVNLNHFTSGDRASATTLSLVVLAGATATATPPLPPASTPTTTRSPTPPASTTPTFTRTATAPTPSPSPPSTVTRTPPPTPSPTETASRTLAPSSTSTKTPSHTPTPAPSRTGTPSRTLASSPSTTTISTQLPTQPSTASPTHTSTATLAPPSSPTGTETPAAPPPTETLSPQGTPTSPAARCTGDCRGDGAVSIDEVVQGVRVDLGLSPLASCDAIDANRDDVVSVDELVAAVRNAMTACP